MATETKMGMAIVVILVCAFGFLVYHKFDLKQQALASIDNSATDKTEKQVVQAAVDAQKNELKEFSTKEAHLATEVVPDEEEPLFSFLNNEKSETSTASANDTPVFDMTEPQPDPESSFGLPADKPVQLTNAVTSRDAFAQTTKTSDEENISILAVQNNTNRTNPPNSDSAATDQRDPFVGIAATPIAPDRLPFFKEDVAVSQADDFTAAQPEKTHMTKSPPASPAPFPTLADTAPAFHGDESDPTAEKRIAASTARPLPLADSFLDVASASDSVPAGERDSVPEITPGNAAFNRIESDFPAFSAADLSVPATGAQEPANADSKLIAMLDETPNTNAFADSPETRTKPKRNDDSVPFPATAEPTAGKQKTAPGIGSPFADTTKPSIAPSPAFTTQSAASRPSPQLNSSSQPSDGGARFVDEKGIQQVSGVSDQCEICEVRLEDNYWTISKRTYGTAQYFSALALYNQQRIPDPRKLRPGMKVLIPDPKILEQKYPELFTSFQQKPNLPTGFFLKSDGAPAYRVGERETLSEISQKHLGRASRWMQIYRINQNILEDPNTLQPGTVLVLPDDATNVHMSP